jgi:hypothetical protein
MKEWVGCCREEANVLLLFVGEEDGGSADWQRWQRESKFVPEMLQS